MINQTGESRDTDPLRSWRASDLIKAKHGDNPFFKFIGILFKNVLVKCIYFIKINILCTGPCFQNKKRL